MKTTTTFFSGLAVACLLLLFSCVKEKYDMATLVQTGEWQPEIAIPLIHSRMSVEDILAPAENDKDNLGENSDGLMVLIYRDTLFSALAQDFIPGLPSGSILNGGLAIGGPHSVFLPIDSLDLNLEVYNQVSGGSFYFENPRVSVIITNSAGIPIDMYLVIMDAWSPTNGILPIELWGISSPDSIKLDNTIPPRYPANPGDTAVTVYTFDETNSNVKDFLQIAPKYIFYSVRAIVNPNADTDPSFFVIDTSQFSVEVEVQLPLHGTANFVTLGDTMPFELDINDPSGSDLTMLEATFMINTYNGFPADVNVQLLFLDTINNVIIDSLMPAGQALILAAAPVGPAPALRVTSIKHQLTEVFVDKARLDNIALAHKLIVRGQVSSNDGGATVIKIYSDYTIEIKLGVRAKLQIGS